MVSRAIIRMDMGSDGRHPGVPGAGATQDDQTIALEVADNPKAPCNCIVDTWAFE